MDQKSPLPSNEPGHTPLLALSTPNTPAYFGNGSGPPLQHQRPRQVIPLFLRGFMVWPLIGLMVIYAICVEVILWRSEQLQGWHYPGINKFGGVNFLKSVVPVIFTLPITTLWVSVDQALTKLHPWVMLSKRPVPARQSVLLDYATGRLFSLYYSVKYGHWVVFFSSVLCLANLSLSPLASGLLTTTNARLEIPNTPINSQFSLGVNPDWVNLEYFFAASGYMAAAAINNLTDPPFIFNGAWAIAPFEVPQPIGDGQNQTIVVPTVGIESNGTCQPADTIGKPTASGGLLNIDSTWSGCPFLISANDTNQDQYGVLPVANCQAFPQDSAYQPVLFWFYSLALNEASVVFCTPAIELWNVVTHVDLSSGLINHVDLVNQNVPPNNISSPPFNGKAFNGITFNTTGLDQFGQARALAVQAGVPFAIMEAAQTAGGVANVIQNGDFVNITQTVYTRFLALATKDTFYISNPSTIASTLVTYETRLWVYPLDAHVLAGAFLGIALLGALIHWFHARARRDTYLACDTSTIAGIVSMTSGSRWPTLLRSGMDEDDMHRALQGMRFGMSRRTWQVVAQGEEDAEARDLPYQGSAGGGSRNSLPKV